MALSFVIVLQLANLVAGQLLVGWRGGERCVDQRGDDPERPAGAGADPARRRTAGSLALRRPREDVAARIRRRSPTSRWALALIAGIGVNWSTIVSLFGSLVMLASLVVVLVSRAAGYFAGGRDTPARVSMAMVSGVRFGFLGLIIIGTQLHGDASYLGSAIVFALVNTVVAMLVAVETGRRAPTAVSGGGPAPAGEGAQAVPAASPGELTDSSEPDEGVRAVAGHSGWTQSDRVEPLSWAGDLAATLRIPRGDHVRNRW